MNIAHRFFGCVRGGPGLLVAVAFQALPVSAASPPPSGDGSVAVAPRCEVPILGRDRLAAVCALSDAAPHDVHVKVHFTGSHDDTTASLQVAIGDAPVACDAGSKTSTEFEQGEVTLDCRWTASVKRGAPNDLRVSARWFHAQYVNFEVNLGPPLR